MVNTEHVSQIGYNYDTVNNKRNLDRVKNITLVTNNFFCSFNVSNNLDIIPVYKIGYWNLSTIIRHKITLKKKVPSTLY